MAWSQSWGAFWASAWGDGAIAPSPNQNAWGDSWGEFWSDAWGGNEAVPTYTPANVTVRLFRVMYLGGAIRDIGSTYVITTPFQFTPYGMTLVSTPPTDWNALMEAYNESTDHASVRVPGRYENRIPTAGGQPAPVEAGNPYD